MKLTDSFGFRKNMRTSITQIIFFACAMSCIILTGTKASFAQEKPQAVELPALTKKQMYADIDDLIDKVRQISPQNQPRKKITGIDPLAELKKMRSRIPQIRSTAEFAFLIRSALTVLQDGHSSLVWNKYLPDDEMKKSGVSDAALALLPVYEKLYVEHNLRNKLNLQLKYIGGEYFNVVPFTVGIRSIAAGMRLTQIDGENVHTFVKRSVPHKRMMRWDFKNSRYYAEDLVKSYNLNDRKAVRFTFESDAAGRLEIDVPVAEGVQLSQNVRTEKSTLKRVAFLADHSLLYVRVPRMSLADADFYPSEIKKTAAGQNIQKVVIDVRDNPGGSDNVWFDILSAIIAGPSEFENFLLANPSKLMKEKYAEQSSKWEKFVAPYLDNTEYAVFASGTAKILPYDDSIKYGGKIYILQNEDIYSSTGSLTAIGVLADNIFTVGSPTGRLLGRGINPLIFELPHSKIVYRIEPVIDFLNVKKASDIFHDQVEIPVDLTIDQYLERMNYAGDVYENDFLLKRDPVFRAVLNLK